MVVRGWSSSQFDNFLVPRRWMIREGLSEGISLIKLMPIEEI